MAKKRDDLAAAKAKKQKTILIVGGVLLLAVAAFQGPKLMKAGSTPAPEAAAAESTDGSATPEAVVATGTTPAGGNVVVAAADTGAVVAGVALPRKSTVKPATSQLASFTLFDVKDPFVPQEQAPDADAAESDPFFEDTGDVASTDDPFATGGESTTSSGGATPEAAPPPKIVYATIDLDGKPQQVTLKQKFPAKDPLFVLRSLKAKQAKIGVAGGSFDDGQAVTLPFGKKVTLVNTATGVRYELKLVYTGSSPEVIEGFTTTGGTQPAAGSTSPTTTPAP